MGLLVFDSIKKVVIWMNLTRNGLSEGVLLCAERKMTGGGGRVAQRGERERKGKERKGEGMGIYT